MLGNRVYKLLKSNMISDREKIEICLYFTDIKEIFRTFNENEALNNFKDLLIEYKELPYAIR